MAEEQFEFDLDVIEVQYKIGGHDYLLVEIDAEVEKQFRNRMIKSAKIEKGAVTGLGDLGDGDLFLLSSCLFLLGPEVPEGEERVRGPVPMGVIAKWPHRVTKPLLKKLKDISDWDDDPDKEDSKAKNEQEATPSSSE